MANLKKGLIIYLSTEVAVLFMYYLLIVNNVSFIFELLESLMVLFVLAGIYFTVTSLLFRLKNKIDTAAFAKYFLLGISGILLPFICIFCLLLNLHSC